jgi:hypothetical protein
MYNDLVFMALCAFVDENNIADFRFKDIKLFKEKVLSRCLKELEGEGRILNITVNGFYPRYRINNPVECPEYIYDERLTIGDKFKLLKASTCESLQEFRDSNKLSGSVLSTFKKKMKELNIDILNHHNSCRRIKKSINVQNVIKTDKGMKYSTKKYDGICECCGEKGEFTFRKTICDKCFLDKENKKPLEEKLIKLVNGSIKSKAKRNLIHSLTKEEIKDQLIKQDYKCFYTGLKFSDKIIASVDRIDSNKGYTKNNIVICDKNINIMKSSLDMETFKKYIKLIAANL